MGNDLAAEVRKVRAQFDLTQEDFAARFGLSCATVREWETARRRPGVATQTLLRVIARTPEAVMAVVVRADYSFR